jgi:hypothetical protein
MSYSRFAYVPRMAFDTESGEIIDISNHRVDRRHGFCGGRCLSASEKNYGPGRPLSPAEQSYIVIAAQSIGSWEEH